MPNLKLTVKLTALTVASLATAGLFAQPVFSQSVRSPTAEKQTQAPASFSSEHKAAAVQLYRSLDLSLDDIHTMAAKEATASAIADFKAATGRDLTERESQQMFDFWQRKFEEIFTQESLETAIAAVYTQNFTLEELTAANQSANPPERLASPAIMQEIEAAVMGIANRFLTDETWMNNTVQEVFEELPFMRERFER